MTTKFDLWLEQVNKIRKEYWDSNFSYKEYTPLQVHRGKKYIKIINDGSVWGFVAMVDGYHKGLPVKRGDLLKPASWNTPAKHSRGNIFNGTAKWEYYGPKYM